MMDQKAIQTVTDVIDPARARALQATLGMAPSAEVGTPLPPFFHHIYFWDPQPPENLGHDGHPAVGGFIPDMGLKRRMWAAGRLLFHGAMLAGVKAEKTSMIEGVTRKNGRTGPLAFVRVRHDVRQRGTVILSEWQDVVYRDDGGQPPEYPTARADATFEKEVSFDSTTLFRYSALTFNGHRIHYDAPYAKADEGYAGLVTHGPLLAQQVMLMGEERLGQRLSEVTYRATAPLIAPATATLCWNGGDAWVRGPDGKQCLIAQMR